jgi:hypothetical protein
MMRCRGKPAYFQPNRSDMRIPSALELTLAEWTTLRAIVASSFTPTRQIDLGHKARLLELGLVQSGMGGLMPTPAGRMVARR